MWQMEFFKNRLACVMGLLLPLAFVLAATASPVAPSRTSTMFHVFAAATSQTPGGHPVRLAPTNVYDAITQYDTAGGFSLAAKSTGGLENANFAQKTFSPAFSPNGTFAGRTVQDVAAALRSGAMTPTDVPVQYVERDGQTLILNTRPAQALEQAGIPRAQWNAVNVTGNADAEARLTRQLLNNGLTSAGTPTVRPSGGG
jgi:hypothetical protein